MVLVGLLLPLVDHDGQPLDRALHREVATELTERFGGLTAHPAPATGLWKPSRDETTQDEIVIDEVMPATWLRHGADEQEPHRGPFSPAEGCHQSHHGRSVVSRVLFLRG